MKGIKGIKYKKSGNDFIFRQPKFSHPFNPLHPCE